MLEHGSCEDVLQNPSLYGYPSLYGLCGDWLQTKCDHSCNLCACNTVNVDTKITVHCSGESNGICRANCSGNICHSARCECLNGWTGNKCEIPRNIVLFLKFLHGSKLN